MDPRHLGRNEEQFTANEADAIVQSQIYCLENWKRGGCSSRCLYCPIFFYFLKSV